MSCFDFLKDKEMIFLYGQTIDKYSIRSSGYNQKLYKMTNQ